MTAARAPQARIGAARVLKMHARVIRCAEHVLHACRHAPRPARCRQALACTLAPTVTPTLLPLDAVAGYMGAASGS